MQIFTANAHNFHVTAKYVGATLRPVASRVSISATGGGNEGAMRGGKGGPGVHCTAMLAGTRTTNALTAFSIYDPELFASLKWISHSHCDSYWDYSQLDFYSLKLLFCTCQLTL